MQQALIIFVRRPVWGKVKTRLAASIGNDAALAVYEKLLQHTLEVTKGINAAKYVFYADETTEQDMWKEAGYRQRTQAAGDLGERMKHAFQTVLAEGAKKACIIGSDCYELSPKLISTAFARLDECDVVIGPAADGGYYLLGMKSLHPSLFLNKKWSTESVFGDTLQSINAASLSVAELPVLNDVDEAADVPQSWLLK